MTTSQPPDSSTPATDPEPHELDTLDETAEARRADTDETSRTDETSETDPAVHEPLDDSLSPGAEIAGGGIGSVEPNEPG